MQCIHCPYTNPGNGIQGTLSSIFFKDISCFNHYLLQITMRSGVDAFELAGSPHQVATKMALEPLVILTCPFDILLKFYAHRLEVIFDGTFFWKLCL